MGTIRAFFQTYTSQLKLILGMIILGSLVAAFFYVRGLQTELKLTKELSDTLTMQLAESEQQLSVIRNSIEEERAKALVLSDRLAEQTRKTQTSKRQLDQLRRDFDKLSSETPDQLTEALVRQYNDYVLGLSCITGDKKCEK